MQNIRRGMMVVLSSPSGAGKTTISKKVLQTDNQISLSVSYTTRPRRSAEVDGIDYHFIAKESFEEMISKEEFVEYASVFGNFYGTPKIQIENHLNNGRDILFDIDWQGTRQLVSYSREDVVSIFVLPPSLNELERRLRGRAQDSEEVLQDRMQKAKQEISHWDEYDYVIVNNDVEQALIQVLDIIHAERIKRHRNVNLNEFVQQILQSK